MVQNTPVKIIDTVFFLDHDLYNLALDSIGHCKTVESYDQNDQVYQVAWSWSLWFSLYTAYMTFLMSNATALTFDLEKQ
jgi:hypothetical protein